MSYRILLDVGHVVDYVTTKSHGIYPAGTSCRARRAFQEEGCRFTVLVLEFPDGNEITLHASYLEGHEPLCADEISLAM
jgi:hypothetical protein